MSALGSESAGRRALRIASAASAVSGSYLGYLAQSVFLGEEARQKKLKQTHTKAARQATDELSVLRGPIMKLGQMLSLHTNFLPEETVAELSALQMRAPGMHSSLVRAQFRASLGRDPEEVFREFELTPFAAASLGQVHRAIGVGGERLAVKIQYPGIRDAIENDFKALRAVSLPAQVTKFLPSSVIDELQTQILAETDYCREADNIALFQKKLKPLEYVEVPRVHRSYSSDRVLTMSRLEGDHLEDFLARRPSQRLRDTVGERLMRLYYFQLLNIGAFHADPHWGNYLFRDDGSIGLVDFGCVKYVLPKFVDNLRAIFLYPEPRDSDEFRRLLIERYSLYGAKIGAPMLRALVLFSQDFFGTVYPPAPEAEKHPIDFSDDSLLREYARGGTRVMRAKGTLPEYVFLCRAEAGLYQTLHRLRSRVHTSRIIRECLGGEGPA